MTPRQQIFAVVVCLLLAALIVELVRRRRLSEYHSGLWLVFATGLLVLVLWYGALESLSAFIGARVVTTTVFILAFLFLVVASIHISTELTRLDQLVRGIAQEIALFEARFAQHTAGKEPPGQSPVGHVPVAGQGPAGPAP